MTCIQAKHFPKDLSSLFFTVHSNLGRAALTGLNPFNTAIPPKEVLDLLSECTGLTLPSDRASMLRDGLSSFALEPEVKRGREAVSIPVLAGIELVDLPGITNLRSNQILADLAAIKRAGPAGLAISWDLLYIPLERLQLVRRSYLGGD